MTTTIDVLCERLGISVAELAETSGLPPERVEAIRSGRWLPSPTERTAVARALNVGVEDVNWGHSINPRNVRYHRFGLPESF